MTTSATPPPAEPPPDRPESTPDQAAYAPLERPIGVLIGCAMSWLGGAFGVLSGVALITASGDDQFQEDLGVSDEGATGFRLFGVLLILWCGLVIAFAVWAFRRQRWAARGLGVMGGAFVIVSLAVMAASGGFSGLLSVLYVVAAVALILVRSKPWYTSG